MGVPNADRAGDRTKAHGALAAASRVHILELLRDGGTPLDVRQIAAQTGLHPNTVRFHLRILVDAGLTRCRSDPRGGSGRPRLVYTATAHGAGGGRPHGFELLADILAGYLTTSSPIAAKLAEEAGRAFVRRYRTPARPFAEMSAPDAVRLVVATFAELGFEPELVTDGSRQRILLHACPFHAVASKHPDVVCSIHFGLLKQTLANLDAPIEATGLEPFVTPHLCIAHLAPSGGSPGEPTSPAP